MRRRDDWSLRLNDALMAARSTPFAYGRHDCLMFALALVETITGEDAAREWRGLYTDEQGAAIALRKFAGLGMTAALERFASLHDWTAVEPAFAQRGDLVLIPEDAGDVAGICVGASVVIAQQGAGWTLRPLLRAKLAWRIG